MFLFKNLKAVPWIFNNIKFSVFEVDKTYLEYALEESEDIVISLLLEMTSVTLPKFGEDRPT
jgi:hypothetical protein